MRFSIAFAAALAFGAATLPAAASAQAGTSDTPVPAPEPSVLDGDHVTIGVGGVYGPSYIGSDDYRFSPIPLVLGSVAGIAFTPRPNGIGFDLIPDGKDPKFGFILGPVATYSRNRHSSIDDPVVRAAGKLKSAIDLGVTAGVVAYQLLDPYDSLTVSADARWNVNKAYEGMVITPSVTYSTPVSRGALVSLGAFAEHVDDDYASYYYDVSPAQSAASGLPLYFASSGWSRVGANLLFAYDLDGNLLNGGLSLVGIGSYAKLLDDAKRTPYTSIRGDDNQWTVGAGIAYTF